MPAGSAVACALMRTRPPEVPSRSRGERSRSPHSCTRYGPLATLSKHHPSGILKRPGREGSLLAPRSVEFDPMESVGASRADGIVVAIVAVAGLQLGGDEDAVHAAADAVVQHIRDSQRWPGHSDVASSPRALALTDKRRRGRDAPSSQGTSAPRAARRCVGLASVTRISYRHSCLAINLSSRKTTWLATLAGLALRNY